MKEEIIEYLSERRDFYKRRKEKEERRANYDPATRIYNMGIQHAFEEAIEHIRG